MWSNIHTHSKYCDGQGELIDYVSKARELAFYSLGFSSHAPLPFENDWTMSKDDIENYVDEIKQLKNQVDTPEILLGLEIDYIKEINLPVDILSLNLDYTISSVHFAGRFSDGRYWAVDSDIDGFKEGVQSIYDSDIRKAVEAYYLTLVEMVRVKKTGVLGHFDLVKKNNLKLELFDEQEDWYKEFVEKVLCELRRSRFLLEINTGGMSRGFTLEPYPSFWILRLCFEKNIPVTLTSDAHEPDMLIYAFRNVLETVYKIGYRKIFILTLKGWQKVNISRKGLEI